MEPRDKAISAARLADESKAEDIKIIDVSKICNFTDFFVIATCGSSLQLRSLGHRIERQLRESEVRPIGSAGYETTSWVVVDYGDVIVHLFNPESREHYRLDRLWRDGKQVDWMAAV